VVLALAGCAGDDDSTIGTPNARVEGLVDTPQPAPVQVSSPLPSTPVMPLSMPTYDPQVAPMSAPPPAILSSPIGQPVSMVKATVSDVVYIAPVVQPEPESAAVAEDANQIRNAMAREVPAAVPLSAARRQALITLAQQMAAEGNFFVRRPQLVLIVDRASSVQLMAMTLAQPDGQWEILGTTHVSTGKPGRKEHYKTPVGVLVNDGSELGYRAQGTYNQNHIRGLGVKGMRVWDFGWQTTDDWKTPGATTQIRVEMHATDPSVLEQRIGRADSEGCIRVPDAVNKFLDHHGIIDADLEKLAADNIGYRALLPASADPTPIAGDAVIVVDSSAPWLKPHAPATTVALSD
jgi:lipoprotein-anchoring transpeptidase ErfK/SrfK